MALVCDAPARERYDIRTVQELLGRSSVETTMIYTHVMNKAGRGTVRHYCPELREYYPAVETCPSPWLKLVP